MTFMQFKWRFIRKTMYFVTAWMKTLYDGIRNDRLKHNILKTIPFWTASIVVGVVSVLYTRLFEWAEILSRLLLSNFHWAVFIVTPATFLAAYYLVVRYAPFAKGSGIPQVMAAIHLADLNRYEKSKKLMNLRMIAIKVASSILMIFGGGAIGREGPTIQISGAIFSYINSILPSWWPRTSNKTMVMTGAAAGLAAAFNTPLGGVVFVIEELTKTHISYFKTAIFTAVVIAGLTAQGLLGPYLYIGSIDLGDRSVAVFFVVILVAVVSGLGGAYMGKWIVAILKWKSTFRFKRSFIFYVLCCALLMASMAYFIDMGSMGTGKELIINALFTEDKYDEWYMPFLRIVSSTVSFSVGASGGIFAPSLSTGATIGSVLASFFDLSPVDTNIVILSGMAAFLTGVTRSPFTSAILVLEMTARNPIIFHMLVSGIVANIIAYSIARQSLYDYLKRKYLGELGVSQASMK